MYKLDTHDGIIKEKLPWIFTVSADATDDGGEVDDDIGPWFLIHVDDRRLRTQIILFDFRDEDPAAPPLLEFANDMSAQETGPARDNHALIAEEIFHLEPPEYFLGFLLKLEREDFSVGIDHQVDKTLEVGPGPPSERLAGF